VATARGSDGALYFALSLKTGYRSNAGEQYTSTNGLTGPWVHNGPLTPKSNSTFDSQSTYMLGKSTASPVARDLYFDRLLVNPELTAADGSSKWMYMGDRWLNPDSAHAAYVWLPALMSKTHMLDIQFHASWDLDKYLSSTYYETLAGQGVFGPLAEPGASLEP